MKTQKRKCKHEKVIMIEIRHFCQKCYKDFNWQCGTIPQGHKDYEIKLKELLNEDPKEEE